MWVWGECIIIIMIATPKKSKQKEKPWKKEKGGKCERKGGKMMENRER